MTEERNAAIAEFMGAVKQKLFDGQYAYNFSACPLPHMVNEYGAIRHEVTKYLKFDSSFDWLMPVIHKAYDVTTDDEKAFAGLAIFELGLATPIDQLHEAVYEFTQWYKNK